MERSLQSLFPLISRRFQSFAEATDAVLDVLAREVPGEIVLGQIESGEDSLRVLDVRGVEGAGIERGHMLPLAQVNAAGGLGPNDAMHDGTRGVDDLAADHLQSLGLAEWIALPLEVSDGAIVGLVAALSRRSDQYRAEHVVLLGVAARMLAYEWERVQARNELRQLRHQIGATTDADNDTGLPNRDRFVDLLEREWKLARRGTIDSMAVCFRVVAGDEKPGSPLAVLAMKDAAEALSGAARSTDQVARVGDMELAVAMVGCEDEAGVDALNDRFLHALRRVTHGRPIEVTITRGHCPLAGTDSAEQALHEAERALELSGIPATNGHLR